MSCLLRLQFADPAVDSCHSCAYRCVYELANYTQHIIKETEAAKANVLKQNESRYVQMPIPDIKVELSRRMLILSLDWPSSFSCAKVATLNDTERKWLEEFRCREKAECFKPSDRATVLACIRAEWGSEEKFDEFVQTRLVEVFEHSKQLYQAKLRKTASHSLEMAFGG